MIFEEKNKLSLLHRQLLFNKTNELISLYKEFENKSIDLNEYNKKFNNIFNSIEEINKNTTNIKWFIELNINKDEVNGRIKKLGGE